MTRISLILIGLFTLLMGIFYPLLMTGFGLLLPFESKGSLLHRNGKIIGAELIGQNFSSDRYFHPRPSAANYDAANSTGSNLSPTSQKLSDQVQARKIAYQQLNKTDTVPPDALYASGSGLDPHISLVNARLQAPRVAGARNISVQKVLDLIEKNRDGIIGPPRVHVLKLNLELDEAN
jgi:K+-transporting ATPase ATPase C chain